MVVLRQKLLYSVKVVVFGLKWLFLVKLVIRATIVLFGQKRFYSGKRCCFLAKVVVFGQKFLYSVKMVVFGNVVVFDQKLLYSGKLVVRGQSGCVRTKVYVIGQGGNNRAKWLYFGKRMLYSGKNSCIRAKWL